MRRGKWLFHHDPYREQSPVFQVKNNPVRITAALEVGLYPQIQVLVGDNPDAPGAVWVDWRKNNQELRLGTDEATQTIIASAGWYRLDTDDLIGSQSMVWVEDEEGTLDRIVTPMTMLRPACSASAQPPIMDPIDVDCARLYALLQSDSLQGGRWYRLTGVEPLQLDGQPFVVYLQAVDSSNIEWAGWLECEPFTQDGRLWPCHLVWQPASFGGPRCWLEWVHDLRNRNILRGLNTISAWPFSNGWWLVNNVEYTDLTFLTPEARTNSIVAGNQIFAGRLELDAGAYVYFNQLDRAIIRLEQAYGDTGQLQDCTITQFSTVRASGLSILTGVFARRADINTYFSPTTVDAPVTRLLHFHDSFISFGRVTINGNAYNGRGADVSGLRVEGDSTFFADEGSAYVGFSPTIKGVELKGNSTFYARYFGFVENVRVHDQSFVDLNGVFQANYGIYGQEVIDTEVLGRSTLVVSNTVNGPYYPIVWRLSVSNESSVAAIDCWQLGINNVEVKNRSHVEIDGVGATFFPVGINSSTIADESRLLFRPGSWRLIFNMRACHFFGGQLLPSGITFSTCSFDRVTNIDSEIRYDSAAATLSEVEVTRKGYLFLARGRIFVRETAVDASNVRLVSSLNLADHLRVERTSVSDNASLIAQHAADTGSVFSIRGLTVSSGADLSLDTQVNSGLADLLDSSFTSGAIHNISFAGPAAKTVEGLYSHGVVVHGSVWTANFTGANTRNF